MMAADLTVRQFGSASDAQNAEVDKWIQRGARLSHITETVSMMARDGEAPVLVSVKALDPATYPWYGKVQLEPDLPLGQVLNDNTIAVSDDLMLRLNLAIGASVKLGTAEYRVCGGGKMDPTHDTLTSIVTFGPKENHRGSTKIPTRQRRCV